MDAKSIGRTIAALRQKRGLTQVALGQQLNISSKTVSKWEKGLGFPDITLFPQLASLFGVSIDQLMLGDQKGIAICGNMLVDVVKNIDLYPEIGMMAHVSDISLAVGGCAPNTSIDLSKIDGSIPIAVFGKVGMDENGRYIVSQLSKHGINVEGICFSPRTPTSFSDVMSMPTGERTFFHQKGANSEFSPQDIHLASFDCSLLHIGYLLLLDLFDAPDDEYGTVMARFLHQVQKSGVKTSIDVVSDSRTDYAKTILPALRYSHYAIMNEIECCRIFGYKAYDEQGVICKANIRKAMEEMVAAGVQDKVIIHSKRISFILDAKSGAFAEVPSLLIPEEEIKGSVGAGDAFCAGCLYGLYHNFGDKQLLEFASAAAACSLFSANSVDGMRSKTEIMALSSRYARQAV